MRQPFTLCCFLVLLLATAPAAQSETPTIHERSAEMESSALMSKVKNLNPTARWIGDEDRFWVRDETADGLRFRVVDAASGKVQDAFNHEAMAAALVKAGLEGATAVALPIVGLEWTGEQVRIATPTGPWRCALDGSSCEKDEAPSPSIAEKASPDGTRIAFVQDHNLWLRDATSGEAQQLSHDGVAGFTYGDLGFDLSRVARRRNQTPKLLTGVMWSPDGRYLAALRADVRDVPRRSYVKEHLPPDDTFTVTHPDTMTVADDRRPPKHQISIFDPQEGTKILSDLDPAWMQDFAPFHFSAGYLWWNLGGGEVFFVVAELGGQRYGIAAMDLNTGGTRLVVAEKEDHYYAFNAQDYHAPNFHVTRDGKEAIFYSQRSGSGHLFLYDAQTGAEKNVITSGPWVVFDLIRVDEARREIYFTAGGREEGRNPYYAHLYKVSFDGGPVTLLTPEDADHEFATFALPVPGYDGPPSRFSASGEYFFDVYSTLQQPPVLVLRRRDGSLVKEILRADASALKEVGWQPPEPFVAKAADGKTDLYGALFKPRDFNPKLRYAVVDQTYPGPQIDAGPHSFADNFTAITTFNAQAMAEIGLVVVALDGRGTTRRNRAFRYAFAGTEDVFGAADHKAAIQNLARQRPWMDASRVGIVGASFGGYGALRAALLEPDFWKVVVSHVGPHEYRTSVVSGPSVERFFGVPDTPRDHFDRVSNLTLIDRLEADLMLVYGELDENVPLRSAMVIHDALIRADKDFTSYIVPNANHGQAARHPYIVKRQHTFFLDHLGGPREP